MKNLTLGLLECDHVRPELQHISGDYRDMFPALFKKTTLDIEFRFYDVVNGIFPKSIEECDGYITTGSAFSVYDDVEWVQRLANFVRKLYDTETPYVGICFGHQMLGHALGGKVHKSSGGWCVGVHECTVLTQTSWMKPEQEKLSLLMMCQDQIIDLPPDSIRLASASDCPNAIITVGRSMLGIQAHPEFLPSYDKALMEIRKERIGEEKVTKAISSFSQKTDEVTAVTWIVNFFSNLQKRK